MRRTVTALALTVVTALGASVASPSAYAATSITLEGRGNGHGHGMSQYGAQGAAKKGLRYDQILAFYYPNTSWGTATGAISVLITADTTTDVVVGARPGLTMRALSSNRTRRLARSGAKRWKIIPANGGRSSRLMVLTGSWHTVTTLPGAAEFSAGGAPMRLYLPGGSSRTYRGALRSVGGSSRDTVNVVSLETYLRGVVPREMPAKWQPAAVQAQAVAARTYAAFERGESLHTGFQVYDDTRDQVYGGADAEYPDSDAAVRATAGRVLTYGGAPAFTQFSASDGGWTVDGGTPYLVAQQDPYDSYPGYPGAGSWDVTLQGSAIRAAVQRYYKIDIGAFVGIDTIARDGKGSWGGRVTSLRIVGATTSRTVSGDVFRSMMGLKSTLFHLV
ncbi:hypothetical protein GCM10028801_02200 [Nocardioides maradonensis]